jgi:hypothetical protein
MLVQKVKNIKITPVGKFSVALCVLAATDKALGVDMYSWVT